MEQYTDRYGIRRSRGKAGSTDATRAGVRNAVYDIWGNLISGDVSDFREVGGKMLQPGDQFRRKGKTGIDRFKAENYEGHAGALTPSLVGLKQQFDRRRGSTGYAPYGGDAAPRSQQMTSWGKTWQDAVDAARNYEAVGDRYDEDRMKRYRDYVKPRQKIKSAPYEGSYRD